MSHADDQSGWKQHFPTYQFKERDVALEEYRFATKALEADERLFLNAANLSVVIGAALGSLALGKLESLAASLAPTIHPIVTFLLVLGLALAFSMISLRYFADRQKAVCFAARKVIVLRRMLGMSYGTLQLVLPNRRIEGADEPFDIRMFPGWNTYVAYPCYAIAGIASALTFAVLVAVAKRVEAGGITLPVDSAVFVIALAVLAFAALAWSYRHALLDSHERVGLLLAYVIAKLMNLALVGNVEYVAYRATLATYELQRHGIKLSKAKELLVHIEDKGFFSHRGISLRGLARLFLSTLRLGRRSGGSTITQQLVRTLFIQDQRKLFRRKIIELILASWFDRVVPKEEQLDMYLASVRFENGVFGVAEALKWFFGSIKTTISPPIAFFLIERVSNVRSQLLVAKIDQTLRGTLNADLLSRNEATELIELYAQAVHDGKIVDMDGQGMTRLQATWQSA